MQTSKIVVATLAAALALAPLNASTLLAAPALPPLVGEASVAPILPWLIIGCAGGVILSAAIANARYGKPLTAAQAATCGLLFLLDPAR